MTVKYEHLLGQEFKYNEGQHCYGLLRRFYADNYGLDLKEYDDEWGFWDNGENRFIDRLDENGFYVVDNWRPYEARVGDVFLIAINSQFANHCGIYVGDGKLIHHYLNRLSEVQPYRDVWRNRTCAVVRHRDIKEQDANAELMDVRDLIT